MIRIFKEVVAYFKALSRMERLRKTAKYARIAGNPIRIQTGNVSKARLIRCLYSNVLGQ
jgi:hypothetical protein